MKKNVLSVALLMISSFALAQVGIGTLRPNSSSLLDIQAKEGEFKGVLLPRVVLKDLNINPSPNEGTPNSLLVFNTAKGSGITPGYYYWMDQRWVRLLTSVDLEDFSFEGVTNEELAVNLQNSTLFLKDSRGGIVEVPLSQINLVTTMEDKGKGVFVYTSEDNTQTIMDIPGQVISNIMEILEDQSVVNSITQVILANAKSLKGDTMIAVEGGQNAVLSTTQLSLIDHSITPSKFQPGQAKQILVTDEEGKVNWVTVTSEMIDDILQAKVFMPILIDNNDGTFTHYGQKDIDPDTGMPILGQGVNFDANTLRIQERTTSSEKGIYDFYDGMTSLEKPLMTISTQANSIYFDNSSTVIQGDNLQEVVENLIEKVETLKLNPATVQGSDILINNATSLQGAVLKDMTLSIADGAVTQNKLANLSVSTSKLIDQSVTTQKIAPGQNKYLLATKNNQVQWIEATDDVLKEVVLQNQTITVLDTSANNGTFVYYNEADFDANGKITGQGTSFDANTLAIQDNGKGVFTFTDGKNSLTNPLAVIDIVQVVQDNIQNILSNTNVSQEIFNSVAANGQSLRPADSSIVVSNGEKAVLNNTTISVADQGITPAKIAPGGDKNFLTTINGKVQWTPLINDSIKEVITSLQKVTKLDVDQQAGTFVYYNEDAVNNDGVIIKEGVFFDANTLTINKDDENNADPGLFIFRDGATRAGTPLAQIDIIGTVGANLDTIINQGNNEENIYNVIANKGQSMISEDLSLNIEDGGKAVLNDINITIAQGGVKTNHINNKAVTTAKIDPSKTSSQFLVTNSEGEVAWVDTSDQMFQDIINNYPGNTLLRDNGNGTFTYFAKVVLDNNGQIDEQNSTGVTFNANTLRIEEKLDTQGKVTGKYEFYDQSSPTVPIATIDVPGTVINHFQDIISNQDVQNTIINVIQSNAKELSSDGSITVKNGENAVLNTTEIEITQGGVQTKHIANQAVTADKIGSDTNQVGYILTAGLNNTASFQAVGETLQNSFTGDIVSDGSLSVVNGENVIIGNQDVSIQIDTAGVKDYHIANAAVKNQHIGDNSLAIGKISPSGSAGMVAMITDTDEVVFQHLTIGTFEDGENLTSDNEAIVKVNGGEGAVLSTVTLGINNKSITSDKFKAKDTDKQGSVATVNADGTISYLPVDASSIQGGSTVTTDGIIIINTANSTTANSQDDTVLKDLSLSIADKTITNTKITDGTILGDNIASATITNDKLSSKLGGVDIAEKKILTSDGAGGVAWGEIGDFTMSGENLSTDGIIQIQGGAQDGVGAVLKDITLGIKDNSITKDKLLSTENGSNVDEGLLLVSDGNGGFDYMSQAGVSVDGADLSLTDALRFTDNTNGKDAVLKPFTLDINDKGVSNEKLASKSVTVDKMDSGNEIANMVLTADGQGNVIYQELNSTALAGQGANMSSDGSIEVPTNNASVLKDIQIGIAKGGVKNSHIDTLAVTSGKINSEKASQGSILNADGQGNAFFTSLSDFALTNGKPITSSGQTITVSPNNAALMDVNLDISKGGVSNFHVAPKAISADKISSEQISKGFVLTADGEGGAEYTAMSDIVISNAKDLSSTQGTIKITSGEGSILKDVTLDVADLGISNKKLAPLAVSTEKIAAAAVTPVQIAPGDASTILGTKGDGKTVAWLTISDPIFDEIVKQNETNTSIVDNKDGTFTYFNESSYDLQGNLIAGSGITFNANTLTITQDTPFVYVFTDKESNLPLATIDTRAQSIVFEDNSTIIYNNVEEAITNIIDRLETLEKNSEGTLSGAGILINDSASLDNVLAQDVTLSIADKAVTTVKINPGVEKQILVTNQLGEVQWVDGSDALVKEIIQANEKVTLLQDNKNGTFTYFNESDINTQGQIIGDGVVFNANTLSISEQNGVFSFYDKSSVNPIGIIDIPEAVIQNITEISKNETVQENVYNMVAASGKEISAADNSIALETAEKAVLNPMKISIAKGGVTNEKVGSKAITEDKLFAGEGKESFVPVAQKDGSVVFQPFSGAITAKGLSVDESLLIGGEGQAASALLQDISLQINKDGVKTDHIDDLAVTASKIGSEQSAQGTILTADGSGNSIFQPANDAISSAIQADLTSDNSLVVENGENVLFGDTTTRVNVKINQGGVNGGHIASQTITDNNIANTTISSAKLTAGEGTANRVLVANTQGLVAYQNLSADLITNKGSIKTDGIIVASDSGKDKVLQDVTLSIKNTSIGVDKLNGGGAPAGAVATVGANGVSVNYLPITPDVITNTGSITSVGSLNIQDHGKSTVLSNVIIDINKEGVQTSHIAPNAVTNPLIANLSVTASKMSSEGVTAKSVLLSGEDNGVVWGELGDIITETAGSLTTDNVIVVNNGNPTNALLKDLSIGIAKNSVTSDLLSSKENGTNVDQDYLLVTDGKGGFDYVLKEAILSGGEDLNLGDALEFGNNTTGLNAVLAPTTIQIKDGGIQSAKVADKAIISSKIGSGNAPKNTVLTSNGDGSVAYVALNENAFSGNGASLLSDGSIEVSPENKALLASTSIYIANKGVKNQHIDTNAVTSDKISSKQGAENSVAGSVLSSDGKGNTVFTSLSDLTSSQGGSLTTDVSLVVTANNKAVLQDIEMSVAPDGIKNIHIDDLAVSANKISSTGLPSSLVLASDGQGGAQFKDISQSIASSGKDVVGTDGIAITTGNKAALQDLSIGIANNGIVGKKIADDAIASRHIIDKSVLEPHLADASVSSRAIANLAVKTAHIVNQNITRSKIASDAVGFDQIGSGEVYGKVIKDKGITVSKIDPEDAIIGDVLTVQSDGTVAFVKGASTTQGPGSITSDPTIGVTGGVNATFKDVNLKLNINSVGTQHLMDKAVAVEKLADAAVVTQKLANTAVTSEKLANTAVGFYHIQPDAIYGNVIKNAAITTDKLADKNVTNAKLDIASVYGEAIATNGVSADKISSKQASVTAASGSVLTADGNGNAVFAPMPSIVGDGTLAGKGPITVDNGSGSVVKDVNLSIAPNSISNEYIGLKAVANNQIQEQAIYGSVIKPQAITTDKIANAAIWGDVIKSQAITTDKIANSSVTDAQLADNSVMTTKIADRNVSVAKISSQGSQDGYVLTSDGNGGASFMPNNTTSSNPMNKVFYLPAIYVEVESGKSASMDLYQQYATQFQAPMVSNPGAGENASLPIFQSNQLNYFITYYDQDVFYDVKVSDDGVMSYNVKLNAVPTGKTYFNIVLQIKDE
ncbi:beta strand repeat-containing protein [Myroides sp. LJL115]